MKQHIYNALALRRRGLGMSQQELAARAGLRREKLNRIESREQNIGIDELCRLLDVVGLELHVREKGRAGEQGENQSPSARSAHRPAPREFHEASFIDGARAKIVSWGKLPR
jgi:transcriptional regulator with XRE-family HTH domain